MMNKKAKSNGPEAEWIVEESAELLNFLFKMMSSRSRKAVKKVLGHGQVVVNGEVTTQFNEALQPGDHVQIYPRGSTKTQMTGVKILHEDDAMIVIDKEAGLLSIASEKERRMTAYRQLTDYVQRIHAKNRIFVVHRLDRDTSGVML